VPCCIPIRSPQKHKSLQISSQLSASLLLESPTPLHISTKASSFIPLQGISAGQESSPHSFLPIALHSISVSVPSSQETQPTTLEDKYVLPLHDAHRPMNATRKTSIQAYLAANVTLSQPGAFVEAYIIVDIVQRRGECFELTPQCYKGYSREGRRWATNSLQRALFSPPRSLVLFKEERTEKMVVSVSTRRRSIPLVKRNVSVLARRAGILRSFRRR